MKKRGKIQKGKNETWVQRFLNEIKKKQDLWQKNVQSCLLLCIFCVKTHHGLFPQGRRMPEQEAPLGCVTECSQVIQAAAFKESPLHSGSSCTSVLVIFLHYFIDDFLPIHFLYSLFMKFPLFEVQPKSMAIPEVIPF